MKSPNYEHTVGKHPIPHAEGIAKNKKSEKDEKKNNKSDKK